VHGAEAAKVDLLRKPQLLRRRLDLPLEDIPASKRRAIAATEDEIFRLVELRLGPDPREGFLKDSVYQPGEYDTMVPLDANFPERDFGTALQVRWAFSRY